MAAPILAKMGGKLRLAVVGGAALDLALARAFIGLGLPLLRGYGLTEASPVISVDRDDDNHPESVGPPLPGLEIKLLDSGLLTPTLKIRCPLVANHFADRIDAADATKD